MICTGSDSDRSEQIGQGDLNSSDGEHAVESVALVLLWVWIAQHFVDVQSEFLKRLAALLERVVEDGDFHQFYAHSRPLRAHPRIDEVNGAWFGDGDLLDVFGGRLVALPVDEHVPSEWGVLRRQIGLVREKGLQIEVVNVILDVFEYAIHGLLSSAAIP